MHRGGNHHFSRRLGVTAYIISEGKVQIIIKRTVTSDIKDDINNEVKIKSFVKKKKIRKTFV